MTRVRDLFLLFVLFAVCGWIYEVLLTLWAYGYFENRGFLFGPWLPIYGFGGIALYFCLGKILGKPVVRRGTAALRLLLVFLGICALTTVFELAASYLLDAVGVGYRTLWFYDGEPFNFDGRVSFIASARFGVLGTAALYLGVPLWERVISVKNQKPLNIAAIVLGVLFFIDLAVKLLSMAGA
ncbi:MAG: putative ABC transporter permease [Ruminiclostridium sp.]|nr:putative ABC transporter permease [Ruminiclostridium sp.]